MIGRRVVQRCKWHPFVVVAHARVHAMQKRTCHTPTSYVCDHDGYESHPVYRSITRSVCRCRGCIEGDADHATNMNIP